jgi:mRNA interferase RelE/StbE
MRYTVIVIDEVKRQLKSLPVEARRMIGYRLFLLEDEMGGDVQKLKGSKNEYRLRVGDYRVIFELEKDQIVVYAIGNRKDIYR